MLTDGVGYFNLHEFTDELFLRLTIVFLSLGCSLKWTYMYISLYILITCYH